MTTLRRLDWTLPAFAAGGGAPLTIVQLQKTRFPIGERQKFSEFLAALAP